MGLAFQLIDDMHDGDGLVRALGSDAVGCRAQRLIVKATAELAVFGRRARALHELADWLAES